MDDAVYTGSTFKVILHQSYSGEELYYETIFFDGSFSEISFSLEEAIRKGNDKESWTE